MFKISIAGYTAEVHALNASTEDFCKDYLCCGESDLSVQISERDIAFEREKSAREDHLEGIPPRHFSDAYLETLAVYRKICTALLPKDVLLFHGSVIAVDGCGYLFTAKSGTGKSTHTALWRRVFGERAIMINDDKPLLKFSKDTILAYGTPWNGKHRLGCNTAVPLKAVCLLERSEQNHIAPIEPTEALPMLVQQSFRSGTTAGTMQVLALLERMMNQTRLYRLGCNMDPEAARVAYDGMQE